MFLGPPRVLESNLETEYYGVLEEGSHVLDVEMLFLANAPGTKPRWYHPGVGDKRCVTTIPTHLVLTAGFKMAKAVLPTRGASSQQRQAIGYGAVVLDEEDHEGAVDELAQRAD